MQEANLLCNIRFPQVGHHILIGHVVSGIVEQLDEAIPDLGLLEDGFIRPKNPVKLSGTNSVQFYHIPASKARIREH